MTAFDTVGTEFFVAQVATPQSPLDYASFCVTSIDPIGMSRSLIDVTTLCSEAREYQLALQDGQEIAVEGFYDPADATQIQLRQALVSGDPVDFRIIFSTTPQDELTFEAFVMEWSTGAAVDGVYPLRLRLKPTGALTFTSG
jgi:hypothetical protein